jgi:hypothetical protein
MRVTLPGYTADVCLVRSGHFATVTSRRAIAANIVAAQSMQWIWGPGMGCIPCVCEASVTGENCPCCGYEGAERAGWQVGRPL